VLRRPCGAVRGAALGAGETLQPLLLAAAMFGLGCGVRVRNLLKVGLRPFGLAAASTLLVAVIAHAGGALAG